MDTKLYLGLDTLHKMEIIKLEWVYDIFSYIFRYIMQNKNIVVKLSYFKYWNLFHLKTHKMFNYFEYKQKMLYNKFIRNY